MPKSYIIDNALSTTFSVINVFNVPTDGIVFEEVTNRGYHIQFEKTGLTFEQSVLALQKLACFHAASAVLMENVSNWWFSIKKAHQTFSHRPPWIWSAFRRERSTTTGRTSWSTFQQLIDWSLITAALWALIAAFNRSSTSKKNMSD